ncbi:MAG: YolD-like family protein [Clostridia bacterium]|nr:YolD-like family protein [Clostridia bacterium]
MSDNKLWEGHRLMLPEMRDEAVELKREKHEKPLLTEERVMEIEIMLREAAHGRQSIKVCYHDGERLVDFHAQRVTLFPSSGLVGLDDRVIHYSQITDVRF